MAYILPRLLPTAIILIAVGMITLSGFNPRLYERIQPSMWCISIALTMIGMWYL